MKLPYLADTSYKAPLTPLAGLGAGFPDAKLRANLIMTMQQQQMVTVSSMPSPRQVKPIET
jgi:hypothetical protein